MRKTWMEPQIEVQQFTSNEYVAACGDTVVENYNFVCNAGSRNKNYNVYLADGTPYATSGRDSGGCKTDYASYSPCGETHTAKTNSVFLPGYMYEQSGGFFGGGEDTGARIDVVIWTDNYTDVHCTTSIDEDLIDILRS